MGYLISDGYKKLTTESSTDGSFDYWHDFICDEYVQLDCESASRQNFHGELRGGVGFSDIKFSEVVSDPHIVKRSKSQIAKSTEADFLISFQIQEQGVVRQSGRSAVLTPGSFVLYDSTQPYSLSFNERFHQFVVQMPNEVLSRHLLNPEQYTAIPISGSNGLGAVLTNFIFSLARELSNVQQASEELRENLVNMIAMAFSSSIKLDQAKNSSIVRESLKRRIRQYIDHNLCNPALSNNTVADAQGISIRYLSKLFEDDTESVHNLILHKRLEKSRQILCDPAYSGHSIENIAYSMGFSSAAHFSRSFKKHYGTSPSEIRK